MTRQHRIGRDRGWVDEGMGRVARRVVVQGVLLGVGVGADPERFGLRQRGESRAQSGQQAVEDEIGEPQQPERLFPRPALDQAEFAIVAQALEPHDEIAGRRGASAGGRRRQPLRPRAPGQRFGAGCREPPERRPAERDGELPVVARIDRLARRRRAGMEDLDADGAGRLEQRGGDDEPDRRPAREVEPPHRFAAHPDLDGLERQNGRRDEGVGFELEDAVPGGARVLEPELAGPRPDRPARIRFGVGPAGAEMGGRVAAVAEIESRGGIQQVEQAPLGAAPSSPWGQPPCERNTDARAEGSAPSPRGAYGYGLRKFPEFGRFYSGRVYSGRGPPPSAAAAPARAGGGAMPSTTIWRSAACRCVLAATTLPVSRGSPSAASVA